MNKVFQSFQIQPAPAKRGDNAGGGGLPQTKRVAYRDGKVADAQFVGVGDGDLRQVAGVLDLQQRDVALVVAADQFSVKLASVI